MTKWLAQLLSWGSLLILARYLSPAEFGLTGMAFSYIGFVTLISEFGIGSAIISLRNLNDSQVASLNSVSVIFGLFSLALSVFLSGAISSFFRLPKLGPAIIVMSSTFAISGLRSIPLALLQKDSQFRLIALADGTKTLTQSAATIALAMLGYGYWSIVFGLVAGVLVNSVMIIAWRPFRFARPKYSLLEDAIMFSWRTVVSRVCWYTYSTADFAVAGRMLGPTLLGVYSVAWNFAHIPSEKIVAMVLTVTPTFLAEVQGDIVQLQRYFLKLCETLIVVMVPAIGGIAVLAPDLVPLVLGKQWVDSVVPLQLLGFYTVLNCLVSLMGQISMVTNDVSFGMWMNIIMLMVLPWGFFIGATWGPVGVAAVWLVLYPILAVPWFVRTLWRLNLKPAIFVGSVMPGLVCSALMMLLVYSLRWTPLWAAPVVVRLILQVAFGILMYVSCIWILYPERSRGYYAMARSVMGISGRPVPVNM